MIGPMRARKPRLERAQSRNASLSTGAHGLSSRSSGISTDGSSVFPPPLRRAATIATRGPTANAATMLNSRRLNPNSGVNTKATIMSAGRFRVDDPWTIEIAPSMPAPLLRNDAAMGTMHAEHRFMTGPTARPFRVRLSPLPDRIVARRLLSGKRNPSVRPATVKAKIMPAATRRRYVVEKDHHLVRRVESSSASIQKP